MSITTFEDLDNMIFSLADKFEKMRETMTSYESMRNIIDKEKAREMLKDFFEDVDNSVKLVLAALNNEQIDIL